MTEKVTSDLPLFKYALANKLRPRHPKVGPYSRKYKQAVSALLTQLGAGQSLSEACKVAGVSRRTVYNWVSAHREFRESFESYRQLKPLPHHGQNPRKGYEGPHDSRCQSKVSALIEALRHGATMRRACKIAGLSDSVVYEWKRQDEAFSSQIDSVHHFDRSGKVKESNDEAHNHGRVDLGLQGYNHLYIIKAEGCDLVKVGASKRPSERLRTLQTGSPLKLTLHSYIVGAAHLESEIHEILTLKGLHSHGEWFHESCIPFVRSHIESHIGGLSNHLQQKVMSPIHAMTTTSA